MNSDLFRVILSLFFISAALHLSSCKSTHNYSSNIASFAVIELAKNGKTNTLEYKKHHLGIFLLNFNPISYEKSESHMTLNGIVDYVGQAKYSKSYDTLISGIDSVFIYYGEMNKNKNISTLQALGTADCNGLFSVSFPRKPNGFLVFIRHKMAITGFNTCNYFKTFDASFTDNIIIANPCF